jgi:polyisoprenoid-binding protein YceI
MHRGSHTVLRTFAAALVGLLAALTVPGHAQTRWTVDKRVSLVWWQVSPHLNHLWATTCPNEPSWRPGDNRSPGWTIRPDLKLPKGGDNNDDDTLHVPLWPRDRVNPVCTEAVQGLIVLPDTVTWRGATGEIKVLADALVTGEGMRDILMHASLETHSFPEIRFKLDSLVNMTRTGNEVVGTAVGTLTVRNQLKPVVASVRAFPIAGGMRVFVKWWIDAHELSSNWTPRLKHLGLGAKTNLWHYFFMGADLVFRTEPIGAN